MQFRHEYKHSISYADYLAVRARLQAVMPRDPHAGLSGSYRIRSLYFDNMRDKALREKISGISCREKFRIRCYNFDESFIRLEKKVKQGGMGYKLSAPISKEQTLRILAGDTAWMAESKEPLIVELYTKMQTQGLRPKTLVDYVREPFVYTAGNVRITLDYDIRSGVLGTDLFSRTLPMVPVSPGVVILEVKYDDFLPEMIRDVIQLRFREETAFSKYEACRIYG